MPLTRSQIQEMSEDELRRSVLIPLFRKMGFRDVYDYHGGSLEHGKDIVMWKPETVRERVNFGVVVKATKISGKATGKSGASEVRFQIEQCYGSPYADPITTEERAIHRCWVVSSKEITKAALEAIKGILVNSNLEKTTEFINGDTLWKLVEKHHPEKAVWENIGEIQKVFQALSPHYEIIPKIGSKKVEISVKPRYQGAEREHPIRISTRFKFPRTIDGREKAKEFADLFKTGKSIVIGEDYIEHVELPEFMKSLMDFDTAKLHEIRIGPQRSDYSFLAKIKVECPDGSHGEVDHVRLFVVQVGTDEITFGTDFASDPRKLRLAFNMRKKSLKVSYNDDTADMNARQILETLWFRQSLSKGGKFSIENLDTGLSFPRITFQAGVVDLPYPEHVALFEKLALIQQKTNTPITVPNAGITAAEAEKIFLTAYKIENGRISTKESQFQITVGQEGAEKMVQEFEKSGGSDLTFETDEYDEYEELLGLRIPLGRAKVTCRDVIILHEDLQKLKTDISHCSPGKEIRIRLFAKKGLEYRYANWLSPKTEAVE
jgi:hypothetical protein